MRPIKLHGNWKRSLSDEEQCMLEIDLEKGQYHEWVKKYPDNIADIFGELLSIGFDNPITLEDVQYFQSLGLDIDQMSHVYHCDTYFSNALQMACEWRRLDWMEILLEAKADVNLVTSDNSSPLDAAIIGHSVGYIYNYEDIQDCIVLLRRYKVKREISEETAEVLEVLTAPEAGSWLNAYFTDIPIRPNPNMETMDQSEMEDHKKI